MTPYGTLRVPPEPKRPTLSDSIPLHSYDLIDELAATYPEVIYDSAEERDEFLIRTGERRLVLALLRKREREQEDSHVQ